jgi:hypothetical protein
MILDTPPDRFLHLTATAWTAISSFVSAASVIALIAFNWRYLRWTHKLSDSSMEQVAVAKESLKRLEEQVGADLLSQRHAAIEVLRETLNRVAFWTSNFRTDVRSEQMPQIHLRPDNWNLLVTYASRHLPDSSHNVHAASQGLHNVEVELNRLLIVPLQNRGLNSSLQIRFNGLQTNMDNMRNTLTGINSAFYN